LQCGMSCSVLQCVAVCCRPSDMTCGIALNCCQCVAVTVCCSVV